MRMAKAPKEHIDRLRKWMQFNDELCKIDPEYEWESFKEDWAEDEDFMPIIKHCEDEEGRFIYDYYLDYYQSTISHIHMRIIFGFEILLENVCDPDKDYLDYNKELKELIDNQEWIKLSDRLPTEEDGDEYGNVLVFRETNENQKNMSKSIINWKMLQYSEKETTYWKHLPDNPENK